MLSVFALGLAGCSSNKTESNEWKTVSTSPGATDNTNMMPDVNKANDNFIDNLSNGFSQPSDDVGRRMVKEYGAVFVARGGAVAPSVVVFKDEGEVAAFQSKAGSVRETVGGVSIELQRAAMEALTKAVAEASASGESITPRGVDAAKRSYQDTVELWASRVNPGLEHWMGKGKVSAADAQRIKALRPYEQVAEIFKLEEKGIYFAKSLNKSIIYSVAPPGSSQHFSMLALDVTENENTKVRSILAKHGWFQTVISDLPHFTFLGVAESELPSLGLRKTSSGGRVYWVPNI